MAVGSGRRLNRRATVPRSTATAALLLACSCAGPPPPPAHAPTLWRSTNAPEDVYRASMGDARIEQVIEREFARDPMVAPNRVGVSADGGIVTLQGSVRSPLAKDQAVRLARVVRGVRAVIDRIDVVVLPNPPPDRVVELAASNTLAADPALARAPLSVWIRDGVARLSGTVDSPAALRAARDDVLSVAGVRAVIDDVSIRARRRDDAVTAAQVDRIVHTDPWLDASRVKVSARDGVVELRGWVGSDAERARASWDAATANPSRVDAASLHVDRFTDSGTMRARPGRTPTDSDLAQALADAFVADPRVHPFVPTVHVRNRFVMLAGVAPNSLAIRAADDDARNVPGVAAVRNAVRERPYGSATP